MKQHTARRYAGSMVRLGTWVVALGACVGCQAHEPPMRGHAFQPVALVNQETRTFEQRWLRIDVAVHKAIPLAKSGKKDEVAQVLEATDSYSFFALGEAKDNEKVLRRFTEAVTGQPTWSALNTALTELGQISYRTEPGPISLAAPADLPVPGLRAGGLILTGITRSTRATLQAQDRTAWVEGDHASPSLRGEHGTSVQSASQPARGELEAGREPAITGVTIATVAATRSYVVTYLWQAKATTSFSDGSDNPCLQASRFSDASCIVNVVVGEAR